MGLNPLRPLCKLLSVSQEDAESNLSVVAQVKPPMEVPLLIKVSPANVE